jgi:hypothetical protein
MRQPQLSQLNAYPANKNSSYRNLYGHLGQLQEGASLDGNDELQLGFVSLVF